MRAFGGVEVLVNNVGEMASAQAPWKEITEETIDHVLAIDSNGKMLTVHESGQRMVVRGGGAIIHVGSKPPELTGAALFLASPDAYQTTSPAPTRSLTAATACSGPRGSVR